MCGKVPGAVRRRTERADGLERDLCHACRKALMLGVFTSMPPGHRDLFAARVRQECRVVAARRVERRGFATAEVQRQAIDSEAGAIISVISESLLSAATADTADRQDRLFRELTIDEERPDADGRIDWLVKQCTDRGHIRGIEQDAWKKGKPLIKLATSRRDDTGGAATAFVSQVVRVSAFVSSNSQSRQGDASDDGIDTLERIAAGDVPVLYPVHVATPRPDDVLTAQEFVARFNTVLALLESRFGPRDDTCVFFAALGDGGVVADKIGHVPGRGGGQNWPNQDIADGLNESAGDRPWDNRSWTAARVINARDRLVRLIQAMMREHGISNFEEFLNCLARIGKDSGGPR